MNLESLFIQIVHIFILGIFLLYVGISKTKMQWVYNVLIILGSIAIITFLVQIRSENFFWVFWHIFIIGIILIWTGLMKEKSFDFLYKLLIIIGSGAIGYHLIRLIENIVYTIRH